MRRLVKWTIGAHPGAAALGARPLAVAVLSVALVSGAAAGCKKRQKGPGFQADDLALGAAHACALMKDGSVRCWGKNDAGQLGDKARENRARPVLLEAPSHASELFAGGAATCATLDDGANVSCWGGADSLVAAANALHDVAQLAIAPTFACARFKAGTVSCWGSSPAAASAGDPASERAPAPIPNLDAVHAIAVGEHHACAVLKEDGSVRCWGKNESGQLGDGTTVDREVPTAVPNLRGVIQIAAGGAHTCVTLIDRTASCWGENRFGQLGDGTRIDRHAPTPVSRLEAVRAVALGDGHSCARLYDGTLRCWGKNDAGQQNDGTHTDREVPGMISGLFDVQQLALGNGTVCARLADGAVRCWGRNEYGQAGDGTREERPVPVTVRW